MKNWIVLSLSLLSFCGHGFAASADFPISSKTMENFNQDLRVVNICNLKDCDELNEIMQGHCPEIAVEFTAQTKLPINLFLKGDLLNLMENDVRFETIEIKQTFYARAIGQELILSLNLVDWKPFLEFTTGTASFALSIQDGQPSIVVGAEVDYRS